MAQRKLNNEWSDQPGGSPVASARDGATAIQSPARLLQQLLDERNAAFPEQHVERWSQRRALAFMVAAASGLWIAILVAGAQAARVLA